LAGWSPYVGQSIGTIYFPIDCVASLITVGSKGTRIETGLIGNEGMTGTGVVLGDTFTPFELVNQIEGYALSISAVHLRSASAQFHLQVADLCFELARSNYRRQVLRKPGSKRDGRKSRVGLPRGYEDGTSGDVQVSQVKDARVEVDHTFFTISAHPCQADLVVAVRGLRSHEFPQLAFRKGQNTQFPLS
jgi:hypothetical protein